MEKSTQKYDFESRISFITSQRLAIEILNAFYFGVFRFFLSLIRFDELRNVIFLKIIKIDNFGHVRALVSSLCVSR